MISLQDIQNPLFCFYCGKRYTKHNGGRKSRDHIVPKSKGGNNSKDNIVYCCRNCNGLKDNMEPTEFYFHVANGLSDHPWALKATLLINIDTAIKYVENNRHLLVGSPPVTFDLDGKFSGKPLKSKSKWTTTLSA